MSANPQQPVLHTVTPYITVRNAPRAIEFYQKALGATELMRFAMPDGTIAHAEIVIGDSVIMLAEENPAWGNRGPEALGGSSGSLLVQVPDADAAFARALAAGGTEYKPVENQFWGERSGTFTDPFGHVWTVSTKVEDVSLEEMHRRFADMLQKMAAAA